MSTDRPSWMDGNTPKMKQPRLQPQSVPVTPPRYEDTDLPRYGTHRNVVIGVSILTVMVLFSFFFWVGIVILGFISPPELSVDQILDGEIIFFDDYVSAGRVFFGLIVGVIGTAGAWAIADSVID